MSRSNITYPESIEHIRIKEFLYENIPLANRIKFIKQEYRLGDQIADVFIELVKGSKIVVEIQHTKILRKDLIERTKGYNKKDCHVLWILNGAGSYNKNPRIESGVPITKSEKELHSMFRGRAYYINMGKNGIEASIYALHFAPYFEKIRRYEKYSYKKSLIKRCIVWKDVESLELSVFKHKGFKLAGFLDPNLKHQCINDVVKFVDSFVTYQNKKRGMKEIKELKGLPLNLLIYKFYHKYGLYLLLDVLLYLKFITHQEIKYVLEKELWSQKNLMM